MLFVKKATCKKTLFDRKFYLGTVFIRVLHALGIVIHRRSAYDIAVVVVLRALFSVCVLRANISRTRVHDSYE